MRLLSNPEAVISPGAPLFSVFSSQNGRVHARIPRVVLERRRLAAPERYLGGHGARGEAGRESHRLQAPVLPPAAGPSPAGASIFIREVKFRLCYNSDKVVRIVRILLE